MALGLNQSEFARRLDTAPNKVNQWETGTHLPSLAAALQMCETFQITLDWLFRGERGGLPLRVVEAITAAEKSAATPQARPFRAAK